MPLDGLSLHALGKEMTARLTNGRVIKIYQPWPNGLILHLRVGDAVERLLLSASPQLPAAHLTECQPPNPVQAPVFSMVLRKHLEPARLLRIEQVGLDRILRFVFETFDDVGVRVERALVVELTGRNSNIILIDPEENRVIDALRRGRSGSGGRQCLPGALYEPPFPETAETKKNPLSETAGGLFRFLRLAAAPQKLTRLIVSRYDGFGPFAAEEVLQRACIPADAVRGDLSLTDLERLTDVFLTTMNHIAAGRIEPTVFLSPQNELPDAWILRPSDPNLRTVWHSDSLCSAFDAAFVDSLRLLTVEQRRSALLRPLRRLHARAERKLKERLQEQDRASEAEHYKHMGDLLSAYLHTASPHAESVTVPDYLQENREIEIPLDPRLSPVQNIQEYYRKYQRAKRAADHLEQRVAEAQMEASYLSQLIASVEMAESEDELADIEQELREQRLLPPGGKGQPVRKKSVPSRPLRFIGSEGHLIFVGRNNKQNDQLTLRTARPDDLWFHTKDIPGSHVIMRVAEAGPPSEQAIEEAAMIAAYYSKARSSANVPVDYVARKHVRKPPGAPPGYVIYDHHRTVYVTPSEEKIAALRDQQAEPSS